MKRIILVLSAVALFGGAAWADHPAGLGIGLVGSSNYSSAGLGSQIGLGLKLRGLPIYWGLNLAMNKSVLSIGATGDKYFTDEGLIREKGFKLDWFLGLGGYANIILAESAAGASLGARLPIGLSWHITKEFELWIDVAPSLGLTLNPFQFPAWAVPAELGIRAWLR